LLRADLDPDVVVGLEHFGSTAIPAWLRSRSSTFSSRSGYIGHARVKLGKPARHGRAGKQGEALAPAPMLRQGQRGHVPRQ
jgi:hypothetical protein